MKTFACICGFGAVLAGSSAAGATPFRLMTGVDSTKYPGTARVVAPSPGPGFPNTFSDGDRLAGTSDTGGTVSFVGTGTPMYPPNHVGAMSFLFRRGSVSIPGNQIPIMGIDFLGGPLLDLDGDLGNGARSLVPVVNATPIEIPGSSSHVDLALNLAGQSLRLENFDATGTNEGGPNIQAEIATTLVTLAGTSPTGTLGTGPNPGFDGRVGTLAPFTGGGLVGVYRVADLPVELWYDSIDPNSSSASQLGTIQHFARLQGWLVVRDCASGQFPTLAGRGLGSTVWPRVDTSEVGHTFNTAVTIFGPTATISDGTTGDTFSAPGNGGVALGDAGGDLGAYFDQVVVPRVSSGAAAFVYLEAAGFGINNSGDPVFSDTTAYDVVIVAEAAGDLFPTGDVNGDGVVDASDAEALAAILVNPSVYSACDRDRADVNGDGLEDGRDVQALVDALL